nr:hypothetical protein [Tanacetum cinerariifolium]
MYENVRKRRKCRKTYENGQKRKKTDGNIKNVRKHEKAYENRRKWTKTYENRRKRKKTDENMRKRTKTDENGPKPLESIIYTLERLRARFFWGGSDGNNKMAWVRWENVLASLEQGSSSPPSPDYVPGPEHPPSPDYVPGPEHPPSPIELPYVPEPEYPEYLAPSDDEAPLEDQPLPADASPIAASPDYVADSDPEEDPEEDPEDHQADYPENEGDGAPLGYREAGIRMRALLTSTSHRTDIPEADMPPRKNTCLTAPAPGFEIGESSAAGAARQPGPTEPGLRRCRAEQAGYEITDTWDEIVDKMMEIAPTTLEGVNERRGDVLS